VVENTDFIKNLTTKEHEENIRKEGTKRGRIKEMRS
jgi:hypothetical protein